MATKVIQDTKGKIRDLPISDTLSALLLDAGRVAKIDTVLVTSGGQAAKGTPGKRTGSTRHDLGNAADLQLLKGRRVLNFTTLDERPAFEIFVTAAAANGATGIGAGVDYMGPESLHIGFGSKSVWGAGGRAANAPLWLKQAVATGWSNKAPAIADDTQPPALPSSKTFIVVARSGLRLRAGPGLEFGHITTLPAGSRIIVTGYDRSDPRWGLVDLEGDGRIDGYVFAPFLVLANPDGPSSDCCDDESEE